MSLRDSLERVREAQGRLTPATVVEAATPPEHELHDRFEWDDAVAGHKYRLEQGHRLIQSVMVSMGTSPVRVRGYVYVARGNGRAYEPTEDVAVDPIAAKVSLADMERAIRALEATYGHMAAFMQWVREKAEGQQAA